MTASLSVLGADALGASSLTYSWTVTAVPSGAAQPRFNDNDDNTAQNSTVTISKAGSYRPGHDHRPEQPDGHEQRQRDREPDADLDDV